MTTLTLKELNCVLTDIAADRGEFAGQTAGAAAALAAHNYALNQTLSNEAGATHADLITDISGAYSLVGQASQIGLIGQAEYISIMHFLHG